MSERLKKNEPLTLDDVVELKKAELEQDRQDAMFEAENWDLMPDPVIKLSKLIVRPLARQRRNQSPTSAWRQRFFGPKSSMCPAPRSRKKQCTLPPASRSCRVAQTLA